MMDRVERLIDLLRTEGAIHAHHLGSTDPGDCVRCLLEQSATELERLSARDHITIAHAPVAA